MSDVPPSALYRVHARGIVGMAVAMSVAAGFALWRGGAPLPTVVGYPAVVATATLSGLLRLHRWERSTPSVTVDSVAQRGYEALWLLPLLALCVTLGLTVGR